MMEKIKGAFVNLGAMWSMENRNSTKLIFDESLWNDLMEKSYEKGFNTIFVDVHEGLQYGSHPELSVEGAWTRQKMRKEIKRLKEMGLTLCPKLNFSACHDFWLREYRKIRSTKEYYRVCRDLITELCDLFKDSPYFHIGMDEEDYNHVAKEELAFYRQGKQLWFDMQYLLDCVRDCGKTPIIWGDAIMYKYEEFKNNISPEDLIVMHYYYHGVKKEHWTKTDSREDYYKYYYISGHYAGQGMEYVERDDPFYIAFNKNALKSVEDGYDTVLCVTNFYRHPHNAEDVLEMALNEWPKDKVRGVITAMWTPTTEEYREMNIEGIELLGNAFEKFSY